LHLLRKRYLALALSSRV
jgi:hypothetical protein